MNAREIRTLLDAEAMRQCLQAIPVFADGAARLCSVALERLWVKPGRHFHASYRIGLQTDGGPAETLACAALLRDDRPGPALYRVAISVPTPLQPPARPGGWSVQQATALLDAPRALIQLFPWDHRLPTLALALDPLSIETALGPAVLHDCQIAGYWPGIRCLIRYALGPERRVLYGKVFPDQAGASIAVVQDAIARSAHDAEALATPRVHSYVRALNLLLTEPVAGTGLAHLLEQGECGDAIARVAAALARFHTLPVVGIERRFRPEDDLAVVRPWVALVGAVFPDLAAALGQALAALERERPGAVPAAPALIHRDFYDKQVLVAPSTVGLLDLDTACLGDGEIDVANFCAHLLLRTLQWDASRQRGDHLRARFLETYRQARRRTDMRLLRWYLASALLRLACVYALRPWWHGLAPVLVEESRRALASETGQDE